MGKRFSKIWRSFKECIKESVSVENTKTVVDTGKAVLDTAKVIKEQKGTLEAGYDILKPVLQNSSSFLDVFCSPLAQVVSGALPFVPMAVSVLNFVRTITKHEPDLEECVVIISQAAYLESFQENICLPVNEDIFSCLDTQINIKAIQRELNKLDNLELDAQAIRKAIVRFPKSELAEVYNGVLRVRLLEAGVSGARAEVFIQQVILGTEAHFVTVLNEMGDSVNKLVNLYRNDGLKVLQKIDSIDEYLKNEIASKPNENVFDEEFTFRDIYVPLKAKKIDANGKVDDKIEVFELEKWAKSLLVSPLLNGSSKQESQVLFIQGGPGKGKSVFCRMFADWVREYLHLYFTPILIRLRDIEDLQSSLEETLRARIKYDFAQSSNSSWLLDASRRYLFILDGFDELRIERSNNQNVERFLRQVGAFQEDYKHRGHRVIITGRAMALYGIDRLPANLERVEIADMDVDLQYQWFLKWRHFFPGDRTDNFQQFLQDEESRCPSQLRELAKEPLLLYMLAAMNRDDKLDVSQIEQSKNDTQAKITVYEQALEWVLEKQRYDKRYGNLTEELTQLDADALKRLLAEAAMAVVQSGGEYADIQTVKARLQQDEEAREILRQAENKLGLENALKNTLAAFYIKSNGSGGVEFFHKSFCEFLCAKRIQQSLEDWTEPGRRGKGYYIEEKQFHEQIYDLLGYDGLTREIVEYLFGLLDNSDNFKFVELFKRLEDFYQRWCDGEFIDSIEETLVLNTARKFQKNGIMLGQRAVDVYAGLNVMILLLELHRKLNVRILPVSKQSIISGLRKYTVNNAQIKSLKFKIENNITFYPSGKPEEGKFSVQLLRIINYSDCVKLSTFISIVRQFLSGAYLYDAYLNSINLNGANLSDTNLSNANLRGTYLQSANLRGANLRGANLCSADLNGAYLDGADLGGANLIGANLSNANLGGANLGDANLQSVNLICADLSDANLSGANLSGANLIGADLSGTKLNRAKLSRAYLSAKNLTQSQVKAALAWDEAKYDPDFLNLLQAP